MSQEEENTLSHRVVAMRLAWCETNVEVLVFAAAFCKDKLTREKAPVSPSDTEGAPG